MDNYEDNRKEIEHFFTEENIADDSRREFLSPSGNYRLTIENYKTKEGAWEYSRGIVKNLSKNTVIADIKRNYSHFWHTWCEHKNGCEYLLCGEDYQGQTVINLTDEKTINHFPESGHSGWGFCWVNAYPAPNSEILAVDGCVWAYPYEIVLFDFSNPDELPYKELYRTDSPYQVEGWQKDGTFLFNREIEVREPDQKPYDTLTDGEQDEIDEGKVKSETIQKTIRLDPRELIDQN